MNTDPGKAGSPCGTFRCVLVGIPSVERPAEEPTLAQAIALARACGGAITLYVFPLPVSPGAASTSFAEEAEKSRKLVEAAMSSASATITQAGLDVMAEYPSSLSESGPGRFVQLARVNDVAIIGVADAFDVARLMAIEDVLFDSGRPLLLVPRHGGAATPRRIVIAWDGSARSARAVKDALPLLAEAETVVAVTVEGEKDLSRMAPGADLAAYLARHGIECRLATLTAKQRDVAQRLRLFVAEEDIDMIVMGAFVHSRFRQAVLGGVTQALLEQPPVPLFMAY